MTTSDSTDSPRDNYPDRVEYSDRYQNHVIVNAAGEQVFDPDNHPYVYEHRLDAVAVFASLRQTAGEPTLEERAADTAERDRATNGGAGYPVG